VLAGGTECGGLQPRSLDVQVGQDLPGEAHAAVYLDAGAAALGGRPVRQNLCRRDGYTRGGVPGVVELQRGDQDRRAPSARHRATSAAEPVPLSRPVRKAYRRQRRQRIHRSRHRDGGAPAHRAQEQARSVDDHQICCGAEMFGDSRVIASVDRRHDVLAGRFYQ
jgi:hypothetical protein